VMAYFSLKVFPNHYDWTKLFILLFAGIAFVPLQEQVTVRFDGMLPSLVSRVFLLLVYAVAAGLLFRDESALAFEKIRRRVTRR